MIINLTKVLAYPSSENSLDTLGEDNNSRSEDELDQKPTLDDNQLKNLLENLKFFLIVSKNAQMNKIKRKFINIQRFNPQTSKH